MPGAGKTEHSHIVCLEGVCGGEPVIDGLRVTVRMSPACTASAKPSWKLPRPWASLRLGSFTR